MPYIIKLLNHNWLSFSVFMLLIIGVLSLTPLQELPAAPGSDKLHHLVAYALLAIPLTLRKPRYFWVYVMFFLAFSGLIEIIQPVVNRYGEWLDMLANTLGVICGLACAELLNYFFPARLRGSD